MIRLIIQSFQTQTILENRRKCASFKYLNYAPFFSSVSLWKIPFVCTEAFCMNDFCQVLLRSSLLFAQSHTCDKYNDFLERLKHEKCVKICNVIVCRWQCFWERLRTTTFLSLFHRHHFSVVVVGLKCCRFSTISNNCSKLE